MAELPQIGVRDSRPSATAGGSRVWKAVWKGVGAGFLVWLGCRMLSLGIILRYGVVVFAGAFYSGASAGWTAGMYAGLLTGLLVGGLLLLGALRASAFFAFALIIAAIAAYSAADAYAGSRFWRLEDQPGAEIDAPPSQGWSPTGVLNVLVFVRDCLRWKSWFP
ncbi:MAG: hypothetical protein HYZ75_17310 [Elusimicrobia bacterium]|nr:hypothetical protein [Elusimicrobiota bacterium]